MPAVRRWLLIAGRRAVRPSARIPDGFIAAALYAIIILLALPPPSVAFARWLLRIAAFFVFAEASRTLQYGRAPRLVLLLCGYHAVLARPRLVHVLERNAITVVVTFSSILVTHLHFHRWWTRAGTRLMALGRHPNSSLKDLKGSFPGICYDTIVHLYQSDAIWLRRLEGRPQSARHQHPVVCTSWRVRVARSSRQNDCLGGRHFLHRIGPENCLTPISPASRSKHHCGNLRRTS